MGVGRGVALEGPAESGSARRGSDVAFESIFRTEFTKVQRTIYPIVGEAESARDITQEAFTRLYTHWKKVSGYERPEAWVRRVAIRLAVRSRRRTFMHFRAVGRLEAPRPIVPGDPDLARALLELPPTQRAAIVLFYFEDLPISEAAELMGCSEGTAKVRLHRGRERLREILGEEANDVVG
jgi:RNA polymerase sigma-70 factor (ECF subfamily)